MIKPSEKKLKAITAPEHSTEYAPDDPHQVEPDNHPNAKQLIDYKKKLRLEQDRRSHRQQLADVAKQEREKLRSLQPDLIKPIELQHQQEHKTDGDPRASGAARDHDAAQPIRKAIAASTVEEEILNDEDIFQPRRQRVRDRQQSNSRSNTPLVRKAYTGNLGATLRAGYQHSTLQTPYGVCKVCGNVMNIEGDQLKNDAQRVSGKSDCFV